MDELDRKIINLLLENSKLSYRKISQRLGVSTATIMNRVNNLEKEGLIKKYTARPDYEKLGYDISVIIDVKVSKGRLLEVEKTIASYPSVSAVYDMTGSFDAAIMAHFKKRADLDLFLKKIQTIDHVEHTETRLILNKVKEEFIKVG